MTRDGQGYKMRRIGTLISIMIAIVTLMWFRATPARAQGPNIDDEVNRIAKTLYCPSCLNTPLDVCPTQQCADWRAEIKQFLKEGKTEQQIRDYFAARYGPQVLGAPPAEGFNWIAYILPPLGIVLGALVAWFTVRQWLGRHSASPATAESPEIPREYAERIERELKEL
jgi:cytochrome c-type biogenesis protein CcmH